MSRTCTELGVCQQRQPACPGCAHQYPFAPGAVERHIRRRRNTIWMTTFWVSVGLVLFAGLVGVWLGVAT